VSAAERTRADSHYTRIPAVISGRRISRIRRRRVVVIDPRSLFFPRAFHLSVLVLSDCPTVPRFS